MARGVVRIETYGDRRFIRSMRDAGVDVTRLRTANKSTADFVARAGKATAPKVTGRLARTVRSGATLRAGVVRAGRKSVPYANPTHWGWPARNIKANPWLSKTAQQTESTWINIYNEHVDRIVDSIEGV